MTHQQAFIMKRNLTIFYYFQLPRQDNDDNNDDDDDDDNYGDDDAHNLSLGVIKRSHASDNFLNDPLNFRHAIPRAMLRRVTFFPLRGRQWT